MSLESQQFYFCNACGAIAPESNQRPLRVMVRVRNPESGDEIEAIYILCSHCQNELGKGRAVRPRGHGL